MKFKSFDSKENRECVTEIRVVDFGTPKQFVQTWFPDYTDKLMKNPAFSYTWFEWDDIMKYSFTVGSGNKCYGAFTEGRLDGLICLSLEDYLKIEFLATAPWNYVKTGTGKMRGIGSGLIYFVIQASIYIRRKGEFKLNALSDAEEYYRKIGMEETGNTNENGLKEFKMSEKCAIEFLEKFSDFVMK